MPEAIAAPAPPAAPPAAPPPLAPDLTTPPPPPAPTPLNPDDDANLSLQRLIAKRTEKAQEPAAKPAESKAATTPPAPAAATPPEGEKPPSLTDLIAKTLKGGPKTAPQPAPTPPPAAAAAPAAPPATPPPPPEATPSPAKKKKAAPAPAPALDTASLVREATSAATEAAVRAIQRTETPPVTPVDKLKPDDRRDYEIAAHLATINPRYKDAPNVILDQVNRSEAYAARWEADNKGKAFDPKDEEHNDFYNALTRPWSDAEFNDAQIDLAAELKVKKLLGEQDGKLAQITQHAARVELAPLVDQTYVQAGGKLAKLIGEDVHEVVAKGGYDALHEKDPVTAEVLAATLGQLHPFIEASVQIDDPSGRIKLDPSIPTHAQWNQVVIDGEARCMGQLLDGKVFAKRADWARMNEGQRARHWHLTRDMIIEGALDYGAAEAKRIIAEQNERLKKMGFVRQNGASPAPPSASNGTPPAPPAAPPAPVSTPKPASPTAGTGPPIDTTGSKVTTKEGELINQIHGILFGH